MSAQSTDPWPLTVYPRTLAVLVSVLLRRQQQERADEPGKVGSSDNAVIAIWDKFLKRLRTAIESCENKTEVMEGMELLTLPVSLKLFLRRLDTLHLLYLEHCESQY